jgi:MoCo/4Fe-4S cofactor protein with predicted Tat translocation signal
MSAKDHDEHGEHQHSPHEDNYDAAYGAADAEAALAASATPVHGYWRTIAELEGTAKLQTERGNNEFPPAPEVTDPLSRRNFFQLMGASMALAGVSACRRYEKEEIVPLARRPEDQVPGQARQYATAFELGGAGHALVATSYEGRPIKLDGNPDHPFASGGIVPGTKRHAGSHPFAQAAILGLYDPDRSQAVLNAGKGGSLDGFRAALTKLPEAAGGRLRNIHVLSEATSSPTVAALRRKLVTEQGVQWHEYEPLSWDNERLGTKLAFGRSVRPVARLEQCETIVSIDCDLFVEHPAAMRYNRDFARSRRVPNAYLVDADGRSRMNRLWIAESTFSHTGAMADHRLPLRSEHGLPFAMALGAALGIGAPPASELVKEPKVQSFVRVLAEELQQNRGRAVVIAGRRQPPEVHALVARINQQLDAVGKTLEYVEDPELDRPSHVKSLQALALEMSAGKVGALVILGGNPVYDAPADLDFGNALAKVRTSIHLSEFVNETSLKATWHLPRAHFLEAWGDTRTWDGTVAIAQPLIAPLYGGVSAIELLSMLAGEEQSGEQLVRTTHEALGFANWRQYVHDGHVPGTQFPVAQAPAGNFPQPQLTPGQAAGSSISNGKLEVVFHYSSFTYDGRYANNAWLQETPDFLSKVTWDNYAIVGPETAEALGIGNDTRIRVKVGDREVTLACYTMPGQAKGSIALVVGGGRTAAGRVGNNVGADVYRIRTVPGFDFAPGATVTATGDAYVLASVQEHWDIRTNPYGGGLIPGVNEKGLQQRIPELIKETTLQQMTDQPTWAASAGPQLYWDDENVDADGAKRHLSLFREKEYQGHRWGMAIDLSTCTGCNACMVACQAENNVPVVGRKEVINNREMHWIRIDRYFSGTPSDPVVVHQPVPCQQCENAPCEQVCPVGATIHSDEGLNDMTYNRCIGTRYCANNCPYKVRRFNFLDWNKEWREARNKVRRLLFNPEVTVRMRGVMEKCTFCVQRIQNAKISARAQARTQHTGAVDAPMPDGTVETACQQACPTEAIVFGDLADKTSRVSKLHADRRQYDLLPELYTRPRNKFLARVRNPNPKLEAQAPGQSKGGH